VKTLPWLTPFEQIIFFFGNTQATPQYSVSICQKIDFVNFSGKPFDTSHFF